MSRVLSAVAELAAQNPNTLTDGELADRLRECERVARINEGTRAAALAVFHTRGAAAADGVLLTTAAWLRRYCAMAPGEAHHRVRTATALAALPQTAAALAAGELGYPHAAAIASLTVDVPAETLAAHETELVAAGRQVDAATLRRYVTRHRHALAPAAVVRDEADQRELRGMHLSKSLGGMWRSDTWMIGEVGAGLQAALQPLMRPTGPDDRRSTSQRRHDAFAQLLRQVLESGRLPETAGRKPQLQVTVDLSTLQRQPGAPPAELAWHGPISGEAARRIACDAQVTRIITDGRSQILDVGRTTRVIPLALRIALEVRDGGCVADGCTIPAPWCDAHHVVHWIDCGPTCLENTCLLCPRHHHLYHEGRFTLHRRPDGSWETRPPPLAAAA